MGGCQCVCLQLYLAADQRYKETLVCLLLLHSGIDLDHVYPLSSSLAALTCVETQHQVILFYIYKRTKRKQNLAEERGFLRRSLVMCRSPRFYMSLDFCPLRAVTTGFIPWCIQDCACANLCIFFVYNKIYWHLLQGKIFMWLILNI